MALEDFQHLLEIQSLDQHIKKHLDTIAEQKLRIESIQKTREKKKAKHRQSKEELNQLIQTLSQKEKKLFEIESKLSQSSQHQSFIQTEKETLALQREKEKLTPIWEILQEEILSLLDKQEELEKEIQEIGNFLQGSKETLTEIQKEVEQVSSKEEQQIQNYQHRIIALRNQTDPSIYRAFEQAQNKHRFNHPLSVIQNRSCLYCHFQIDSLTAERVERNPQTIELCTGCGRLLAPVNFRS